MSVTGTRRATAPRARVRTRAIPLSRRSAAAIAATSIVGVLAFVWPMLAPRGSELLAHATDAPLVFGLLVPLLMAVTLSLVADGAMGAKAVALLGVLASTAAALRALGAGIAGLEPIWIVIVLGGYALGAGFGFVLGAVSILASALLTGGIGPWLPFQMVAAAWVGLGAGMLRGARLPGRVEIPVLAGYSALAAVTYGWLLNLWFWPTATGLPEALSFAPGAGPLVNLRHWFTFNLTTSMGYDVPRALLSATAVLLLGRRVLDALHRTSRVAAFDASPTFADDVDDAAPRTRQLGDDETSLPPVGSPRSTPAGRTSSSGCTAPLRTVSPHAAPLPTALLPTPPPHTAPPGAAPSPTAPSAAPHATAPPRTAPHPAAP